MNVVLVEPEIPQNTGNIARTCAGLGATLHLVRPLGFSTSDRYLKRAGLDYWKFVDIIYYDSLDEFLLMNKQGNLYFCTTKAKRTYTEIIYKPGSFFVFGKETKGLDEKLLEANYERCIRIPMNNNIRSLNLSNSVAVVLYEAYRQNGFTGLETKGALK
jgi:tRNA (cytidine/uridine-2'-O-)-methyltransferase